MFLLCLSEAIIHILLQSSPTSWAEPENLAGRLFWRTGAFCHPWRKFAQCISGLFLFLTCISLEACQSFTMEIPEDFFALEGAKMGWRERQLEVREGTQLCSSQVGTQPFFSQMTSGSLITCRGEQKSLWRAIWGYRKAKSFPSSLWLRLWTGMCL